MMRTLVLFVNFDQTMTSQLDLDQEAVEVVSTDSSKGLIDYFEKYPGIGIVCVYESLVDFKAVQKYLKSLEVSILIMSEDRTTLPNLGARITREATKFSKMEFTFCHRKSLNLFGLLPVVVYAFRSGVFKPLLQKGESFVALGDTSIDLDSEIYYIKTEDLELLRHYLKIEQNLAELLNNQNGPNAFSNVVRKFLVSKENFGYPEKMIVDFLELLDEVGHMILSSTHGKQLLKKLISNPQNFEHTLLLSLFINEVFLKLKLEAHLLRVKYFLAALFHDVSLSDESINEGQFISQMTTSTDHQKTYDFTAHSLNSVNLAQKIPLFSSDCISLISDHHEWVDGSGFPRGYGSKRISDFQLLFNCCHKYLELFELSGIEGEAFFTQELNFEKISGLEHHRKRFYKLLQKVSR